MEDYAWIIFVFVFWVVSSLGEMRKAGGKKKRKERERSEEPLPRRPDPANSRRRLDEDLDAASQRAAEALKRWETRQTELARRESPVPAPAPRPRERRRRNPGRPSRAEPRPTLAEQTIESREEAYEAIAEMLGARSRPPEPEPAPRMEERSEPPPPPDRTPQPATVAERPAALSAPARVKPRRGAVAGANPLARLDRYPPLQRAIVLSEIFGPPPSLL